MLPRREKQFSAQYLPSNLLYNEALRQDYFFFFALPQAAGSERAFPMITQHKFAVNNIPCSIVHPLALLPSRPARGKAFLTLLFRCSHPSLPAPAAERRGARLRSRTPAFRSSFGGSPGSRGDGHGLGHCCLGTARRVIFGITEIQERMRMETDISHLLKRGMEWDLEPAGLIHQVQT